MNRHGLRWVLPLVFVVAGPGCRIDPYELGNEGQWNRPDASPNTDPDAAPDAEPDACVPTEEVCDGVDNDCDGVPDNGFDTTSDPYNCGACGTVCEFDYGDATCIASSCHMTDCFPGHWDTNGDEADGCEYSCHTTNNGQEVCDGVDNDCDGQVDEDFDLQNDPNNCGQCHYACAFFQGVGACVAGNCELSACRGGFVDKDGNAANGCECMMDLVEGTVPCDEAVPGTCGAGEVCADVTGDGSSFCATIPIDGCDGVDQDCDGQVDEDAPSQMAAGDCYTNPVGCTETFPGSGVFNCVGECTAGQPTCVGGSVVCGNQTGPAAELCDNLDNDCNGVVDDGYDKLNDPANCGGCGIQCSATVVNAVPICLAGQCQVLACLPGFWDVNGDPADGCEYACTLTNGGVERCGDSVDNDCDGLVDEGFDFTTDPANCGACGNNCGTNIPFGTSVAGCVGGACQYQCEPNHYDLNGDLAAGQAGNGCEYSCTQTNGGVEACDDVDNNCDGQVDEGVNKLTDPTNCGACGNLCSAHVGTNSVVTGCANGVCVFGCAAGAVDLNGDVSLGDTGDGCEYPCTVTNGGVEACDGQDNDCDGQTDEAAGGGALTQACYTGPGGTENVGPCHGGTQTCSGGGWGACTGQVTPQAETCDGADNDCDGSTDEAAGGGPLTQACYTGPVGTENIGLCVGGNQSCVSGVWGACTGEVTPQGEACDGADNDCDGPVDEDYDVTTDLSNCGSCGYSCVAHAGASSLASGCLAGVCQYVCAPNHHDINGDVALGDGGNGCEYACIYTNGGVEQCGDGLDNDCDNQIDEGFDFTSDVDNCGACGYRCADHAPANATGAACVASSCQFACLANFHDLNGDLALGQAGNGCEYACSLTNGGVEICDGVDNDCDGVDDDNPVDVGVQCGVTDVGPCAYGTSVCNSGALGCVGNIDPEVEVCDGVDNDCDGTPDVPACLTANPTDTRLDTGSGAGAANSIQVDMAADGDRIHVVWLDTRLGNADIRHNCSNNGGVTWNGDGAIDTNVADAVKPRVILDPDGTGRVYVAYERFSATGRRIYLRRAAGCGSGFDPAVRLDADDIDSLNIDLAADGNGNVAVVWEDFVEGSGSDDSERNIYLARSLDSGAAWGGAVRVNQVPANPTQAYATVARVAYGTAARLLVVWVDQRDVRGDIYLNYSDDDGATWQAADLRLDTDTAGAGASKFPRIVADGADGVFVVWQDLRSQVSSDIFYSYSTDNGSSWLGADVQLDDEGAVHDSFEPRIVLGQAGYVHVAWRDFREGLPRVRVATSGDSGASFATSVISSVGDGYVSEPRLATDGLGKVFVAFADDRDGLRDVYLNYSIDNGVNFQPADLRLDLGSGVGAADAFTVRLAAGTGGSAYVVWVDTRTGGVNGDIYFNFAD
ncbi:MAG: MopE-related protein [bacterium]